MLTAHAAGNYFCPLHRTKGDAVLLSRLKLSMQTRAPDEGPSDTGIPALGIERRTVIADSEPVGKEDVPTVVTDNGSSNGPLSRFSDVRSRAVLVLL